MSKIEPKDPGLDALVRAALPTANTRILDLGWEGDSLLERGVSLPSVPIFVVDDIRAERRCQSGQTLSADVFETGVRDLFDLVLYRPVQRAAKEQVFDWIDRAFACLKVGGQLCLAGRRDRGVKSYATRMAQVFGLVTKVGQIGRTHIYKAVKSGDQSGIEPTDTAYEFAAQDLPGGTYHFRAKAGVFSRDGIDLGSRLLLENVTVSPTERILDLGCGYGLLGMVCARLAPQGHVRLVDVSYRAVHCAKENIQNNGIENAFAEVAEGYETCGSEVFDLIVSNPPFHEGNAVGHAYIDGAYDRLSAQGRLILVVMRPDPYRKRMQHVFNQVAVLDRRNGYTILCASGK